MKKTNVILIVAAVLVAAAAFLAGRYTAPAVNNTAPSEEGAKQQSTLAETRAGGYRFINPLLECDNFDPSGLNNCVQMENEVKNFVQQVINDKRADHVSVYFRDLNNGPWMGINENENYSPASLLKVPVMIAVLKKAETTPGFLKKRLNYVKRLENSVTANIVDSMQIKLGQSYTVEDLLNRMIEFSDNEAKELLFAEVGEAQFVKVLNDLGISLEGVQAGDDFMSVKEYSSFFRILFNATYLSKEMSEMALGILSKTRFSTGIVAGLPAGTLVSHKFGERAIGGGAMRQLHDCGIVYKEHTPYLVCIMTRGTDFNTQAGVIAEISKIVYRNVMP